MSKLGTTRIPKVPSPPLHCVTHEIAVQDFVVEAIEEKLGRTGGSKKKRCLS